MLTRKKVKKLNEFQCHLCRKQCTSKDDNHEHVRSEHTEYYEGMMEIISRMNN